MSVLASIEFMGFMMNVSLLLHHLDYFDMCTALLTAFTSLDRFDRLAQS